MVGNGGSRPPIPRPPAPGSHWAFSGAGHVPILTWPKHPTAGTKQMGPRQLCPHWPVTSLSSLCLSTGAQRQQHLAPGPDMGHRARHRAQCKQPSLCPVATALLLRPGGRWPREHPGTSQGPPGASEVPTLLSLYGNGYTCTPELSQGAKTAPGFPIPDTRGP